MLDWQDDLKLSDSDLYLDSRRPRALCYVSHAHGDHLGAHAHALGTAATFALAERRTEIRHLTSISYREEFALDARTTLQLLPAGHVLGSSMLFVQRGELRFIYTGDFKLRPCLTVPPAEVREADRL